MSVWVPKTIEDEIACLGLIADGLCEVLRGEVVRRCDSGEWPSGGLAERDLSFNLTETSEAGVSWYYFTFILKEVPAADERRFNVLEFHGHRVE